MVFLFEKYRPAITRDFLFNNEILQQLTYIASNEDIPHIIISGPTGGGKKTLVKFFLEALYDPDVNILTKRKYNINGSSTKKEIEILQSNYHIIIEPTSTNHDKYILQEVIKQYAIHKTFNIFKSNRKFKTIVIYNIENLANNSQAALRRTMELYAKSCRFIMVCNNLSKIFDPLRSRCRTFCVQSPSRNDIANIITNIALMEEIKLGSSDLKYILDMCKNNLKKAIWILDTLRLGSKSVLTLDDVFNNIVNILLDIKSSNNVVQAFDQDIRTNIYHILITNIKGSEIITTLMDKLINSINNDEINAKIIQYASETEYNLIHGRRDIIHIDYFICGVIKELIKCPDTFTNIEDPDKLSNYINAKPTGKGKVGTGAGKAGASKATGKAASTKPLTGSKSSKKPGMGANSKLVKKSGSKSAKKSVNTANKTTG